MRSSLILALLSAGIVSAQTIDFNLLAVPSTGGPQTITNNSQVQLVASNIGASTSVMIVATYTGTTQATFALAPQLVGSTAITVTVPMTETFPLVLTRGQTLTFTVTYAPTSTSQASAQLSAQYTEPGTSGNTTVTNVIGLLFQGFVPSFTLSYVLATDNNIVPLSPGGTISFTPPTQVNTTATAQLNITDTGTGPGTITGVSLVSGGPVFKLSGIPLFPYSLTPGSSADNLPIGILYSPTAVETDTGQIMITYQNGATALVNLSGNGATSTYSYSYLSGTTPTPVPPGGTIVLPSVTVATSGTATTSSVILTATNKGNANGTINSINVTGPFGVSGEPTTPPTLKPGDSESFTITYTPTQVGAQTGSLQVGNDTFKLSGTGLGPQLSFSYVSNGTTVSVGTGDAVVFVPIAISQSEKVTFTVTNSGTSPATISLVSANAPFSLTPAPSLPLTLAPGKSSQFPITFTPVTIGSVSGTLLINNATVPLLGSGNPPPDLPSYTITGPSGNVAPASQSNVSLTLAHSYPVDLDGVLTLTTSGELGTDPSVQFATGSSAGNRTVDFVIPANSTSANFAGQGSQILLQTGTVAETVTLSPSFATTGGVDVTPASPATLQFAIATAAPVLEAIQVTNSTASSFTLAIVGYSTSRSLSSLNITFTPAAGFNLTTSQFTEDLTGAAAIWFQSSASQSFGGQFQITVPFTLTGTVPTGQTLLGTIASVAATVSNGVGTSNSLQVSLP